MKKKKKKKQKIPMKHTLDDGQLEIFEKKNKMMNKEN